MLAIFSLYPFIVFFHQLPVLDFLPLLFRALLWQTILHVSLCWKHFMMCVVLLIHESSSRLPRLHWLLTYNKFSCVASVFSTPSKFIIFLPALYTVLLVAGVIESRCLPIALKVHTLNVFSLGVTCLVFPFFPLLVALLACVSCRIWKQCKRVWGAWRPILWV